MMETISWIFTISLVQPLANGLVLFYRLLGGNLGIAIIVFTTALKFALNPLTSPYMKSMQKMKDFAGPLEKLKAKYKDDKVGFAKAQADFYKEKGINPYGGCLPYVLQIVVLIAFFNVFSRVFTHGGDVTANFNKLLYPALQFGEGVVVNTKFLFFNLATPDAYAVSGLPFKLPGILLFIGALLQLASSKMNMPYVEAQKKLAQKTKTETDDMQVQMQSSMLYTFPLMTLIIGLNFPSALALYWLVFSALQILQQYQTSGWGGLTPLIKRVGLVKSPLK